MVSIGYEFKRSRARAFIFLFTWFVGVVFLSAVPQAGTPGTPAQLWLDSNGTPRVGEPLELTITVVSQIPSAAEFQLALTVPPGVDVADDVKRLSGVISGGEPRNLSISVTPKLFGDFRVGVQLQFLPDGASAPFLANNAAVLRLRTGKDNSQVFVDQKNWSRKYLADQIKDSKASLRGVAQDVRNQRVNILQGLPARRVADGYQVPDTIRERQQAYLQAAQALRAESGTLSEAARAQLKNEWMGSGTEGHLGSRERYTNTDGLVRRGVPVGVVYQRELSLNAGTTYTIETLNLTPGSDPVAYLFAYDETTGQLNPVAWNDDAGETTLGSRIDYTPERSGSYMLVIRSYNSATRGDGDLTINGELLERASFAGMAFQITSDAGDQLHTVALKRTPNRTDTLLFVRPDAQSPVLWDDDGGMELGSRLVLPELRGAELVVGAYSAASEGQCDLILNTADGSFGAHPRGDLDGDGLSNELERALGTDPNSPDTDADGLLDSWEVLGVRDTDYPAMGVNPTGSDIFVQIDWMAVEDGHNHKPNPVAVQYIVDSFAETGQTFHVDDGNPDQGGQGHLLPPPWTHLEFLGLNAQFFQIKDANFDSDKRGGIWHYDIFAHRQPNSCSSGVAFINGKDFLVTLGCFSGQIGTVNDQAGTLMHELGHNLGLQHGGDVPIPNYKPNYRSVMNYMFQLSGTCATLNWNHGCIVIPCLDRDFKYSFGTGADLDENCLDETIGIGKGPLDWNDDGQYDTCVMADINHTRSSPPDRRFEVLKDYNDYANLRLPIALPPTEVAPEEELVTCAPPLPE